MVVLLIIFITIIRQCLIFAKVNIAVLLSSHFGLTFCVMISDNLTKSYKIKNKDNIIFS